MINITIPSTDNKNKLHVVVWKPEDKVRAIVQISHGMIEYIERYDEFARFLNSHGILVIGNDHLGHGRTAACEDDYGYFGEGKSRTVVEDLHEVTKYAKKQYGINIPYFLLGHSMGSFMARRYLITYGKELSGAVLCGTGYTPTHVLITGKFVCGIIKFFKGERYHSDFIKKASFAGYTKRIADIQSSNDWISVNRENVKKYNNDKLCSYDFSINGYQTLFNVLSFIQNKKNYVNIPDLLPIYMVAGSEDPVGNYGKGVEKIFEQYKKSGIKDIEIKLYKDDRHEILNEDDKEVVYKDILYWIEERINKAY